jgi:hypothetical protein
MTQHPTLTNNHHLNILPPNRRFLFIEFITLYHVFLKEEGEIILGVSREEATLHGFLISSLKPWARRCGGRERERKADETDQMPWKKPTVKCI